MEEKPTSHLLKKPISTLELSPALRAMCTANGFVTLADVLQEPLYKIPFLNHSGYRVLNEVLAILENNDLVHLTDDWEDS